MKITEEQIKKIASQEINIKEVFPEVFKFTGWAKTKDQGNKDFLMYFIKNVMQFGFDGNGKWLGREEMCNDETFSKSDYQATQSEVLERLIKQAKEQGHGFEFYTLNNNGTTLWGGYEATGSTVIFNNGVWSEPIKNIEVNKIDVKEHKVVEGGFSTKVNEPEEVKDPTDYKVKYFDACVEIEKLKQANLVYREAIEMFYKTTKQD